MVLLERFELSTSSLPMKCSTPELQQRRSMAAVLPPTEPVRKGLPMRPWKHGYPRPEPDTKVSTA